MNNKNGALFSRRQFTRRAAVLSATASLVPAEAILPKVPPVPDAQDAQAGPKLSATGQAEAGARYQQVLTLYGERLDDGQKAHIKRMCTELQPMLERIRGFPLANGDAPALYLKPLVEREKKPQPAAQPGGKKS